MDSVSSLAAWYRFDKEELLWLTARQMYFEDEISRISGIIRNDEKWLEQIRIKAENKGLPLEAMIRLDAIWVYEQKLK